MFLFIKLKQCESKQIEKYIILKIWLILDLSYINQ